MNINSPRLSLQFSMCIFFANLLVTFCFAAHAMCQEIGKPVEKSASFVVDIQVAKLLSNKTIQPLIEGLSRSVRGKQFDAERFRTMKQLRFIASGDGIFGNSQQFVARCTFNDADAAVLFAKNAMDESTVTETDNGWTILRERANDGKMVRYKNGFLEIGTNDYCTASDESLLSVELQAALAKMDESAVFRVAIESQVLARSLEQVSNELGYPDAAVGTMFDRAFLFNDESILLYCLHCLKELSTISIQADMDSEQLVKLVIKPMSGKGEITKAKVDVLFGFFMMHCKLPLNYFKENNPPAAEAIEQVLAGIKTVDEGDSISLTIETPNDFSQKMVEIAKSVASSFSEKKNLNLFKQVALSVHNYHDAMRRLPFHSDKTQKLSRDLSWRVKLLPYLEESGLYRRMQLDKSWDAMENRFAIEEGAELFTLSNASMICGIECDPPAKSFGTITDGLSNTIMLIENRRASMTPWTKPNDLTIDQAVKLVKAIRPGKYLWIAMYDGMVWKLPNIEKLGLTDEDIRDAFDPRDGNVSRLVDSLERINSPVPAPKLGRPRRFEEKIEFENDARPREFKPDFERELDDKTM